jgi:hypothetical protein
MSTLNPTLARVAGAVAALVLIAIATIGVYVDRNGSDASVAGTAEATPARASRTPVTPAAPLASVEIGPDRADPGLDPLTGAVVLAAYTELSPADWADGVLAGFAPEPTPAPVAPPTAPVAPPAAPVAPPAAPVAPAPPTAPAPVETPVAAESATTQSAAAPESASVQAAPFDGAIVAESVGPAPTPAPTEPAVQNDGWAALRNCESDGNYQINTGNGFYGAYQFTIGTWNAVAQIIDPAYVDVRPDQAPPAVQDRMASALRYEIAWGGWQHWPVCGQFVA